MKTGHAMRAVPLGPPARRTRLAATPGRQLRPGDGPVVASVRPRLAPDSLSRSPCVRVSLVDRGDACVSRRYG